MEALKPMLVLGLLGMILYGAYTVVQQGKRDSPRDEAPAFATADGLSAPVVEVATTAPAAPPPRRQSRADLPQRHFGAAARSR